MIAVVLDNFKGDALVLGREGAKFRAVRPIGRGLHEPRYTFIPFWSAKDKIVSRRSRVGRSLASTQLLGYSNRRAQDCKPTGPRIRAQVS